MPRLSTGLRRSLKLPSVLITMLTPILARHARPSAVGRPPRYSVGVTSPKLRRPGNSCRSGMTRPGLVLDRGEGLYAVDVQRSAPAGFRGGVCEARSWGAAKAGAKAHVGKSEAIAKAAVTRVSAVTKRAAEWIVRRDMVHLSY